MRERHFNFSLQRRSVGQPVFAMRETRIRGQIGTAQESA
jgi:hypothetical protein